MHRRYHGVNIPTEIVRTIVAVSETGSYSKAATRLGLSQPAVSAQIKRIQSMIGGPIFEKTLHGVSSTRLGTLILHQARKVLEANDQLLMMGGSAEEPQSVRLGITSLLIKNFLLTQTAGSLAGMVIYGDVSGVIKKGLLDGFVDIACMFETPDYAPELASCLVQESDEPMAWVQSKNFVLSPGLPIPVINWPGAVTDDAMIAALKARSVNFKVTFSSPDPYARLTAVEAGLGLAAMPQRIIPPELVRARETYLPELPALKLLLCARNGLRGKSGEGMLAQLASAFFQTSPVGA